MRPLHSLLLLVLLIAAGIGGWLLVTSDTTPDGIAPALPHEKVATPDEPREKADLISSDELVQEPDDAGRTELVTEQPAAAEVTTEERKIRGRLIDAAGNPVPGAKVFVAPRTGLGGMMVDLAAEDGLMWIRREEAETGDDGRFSVDAPDGVVIRVAARKPGFAPYDGQFNVVAGESHDVGDIALEASMVLAGLVVDSGGRGVADAELRALPTESSNIMILSPGGRSGRLLGKTDGQGRFRVDQLEAGPWKIQIASEDHPDHVEQGAGGGPGHEENDFVWRLEDGFRIEGKLTGAPAEKLDDVWVRASMVADSADHSMTINAFGMTEQRTADMRADGTFVIKGLKQDRSYQLSAREGENRYWAPTRSAAVTARAGERGVELQWRVEAALVFQVVDASTGSPLEDFDVSAGIDWKAPLTDDSGSPKKHHPEGRVRYGGLQAAKDGSDVDLEITAKGYETFERDGIELRAGEELELGTLRLTRVPLVRVKAVDDLTGEPVAGVRVSLREERQRPANGILSEVQELTVEIDDSGVEDFVDFGSGSSARTDEHGIAELSSLPGKTVRVTGKHKDYSDAIAKGVRLPLGQDHELELRMQVGGTVVVKVVDSLGEPLAGTKVEHRKPGQGGMQYFGMGDDVTDAEGKKTFEHLEPGTHRFKIGRGLGGGMVFGGGGEVFVSAVTVDDRGGPDDSEDWTTVEVLRGEVSEITLTAPTKSALVGQILEGGQPLAGANVRLREKGSGPDLDLGGFFGGGGPSGKTDGSGRFEIEGVDSGDYELIVKHSTRLMPIDYEVTLLEGENDMGTLDLPVCIVEGRVTNQDGEPLAGVAVTPRQVNQPGGPVGGAVIRSSVMITTDGTDSAMSSGFGAQGSVVTDAEGNYRLRGVVPDRELEILAEAQDMQPARSDSFLLDPGQVRTGVDLQLKQGGKILVKAFKADGSEANFVLVMAMPPEGQGGTPQTGFIDRGGATTLSGLAPGEWRVSVRQPSLESGAITADGNEGELVEVVAGETAEVTFDLP